MNASLPCFLAFLSLLSAATAVSAKDPKFDAKFKKNDDKLETTLDKEAVTFKIICPSGISNVEITRTEGDWPKSITLRFELSMLEALTVGNGAVQLSGALKGDKTELHFDKKGQALKEAKDAAFTVTIQRKGMRQIDVVLPASFCTGDTKTLKVEWIDAFR